MEKHGSAAKYSLIGRWTAYLTRVAIGIGLLTIGVLALAAPLAAETWSLQFLGLPMLAVAVADLYATVTNPRLRTHAISYATSFLALTGALILYVSPALVASGLVAMFVLVFLVDGMVKAGQAVFANASGTPQIVIALNGASSIVLALVSLWVWKGLGLQIALGIAIGGYTAAAGWKMVIAPTTEEADVQTPMSSMSTRTAGSA